jgi:hypothetical protein
MPATGPVSPFAFRHHFISTDLPVYDGFGEYGQTALVDIDKDGKLDFVLGRRGGPPGAAVIWWYQFVAPGQWVRHVLGRDPLTDVAACAMDVDGDGWIDLVAGGTWYKHPGAKVREQEFVRYVFDPENVHAHDALAADIDGDGKLEVITIHGDRTPEGCKDGLEWYKIPADPTRKWERHIIGDGVHGALTPLAVADIDGDGDLDIVRADTWFENADGKGGKWIAHPGIPFGRLGPWGVCVKTWIGDIDGDGRQEILMAEADIENSMVAILRHERGEKWTRQDLPQSFAYGSLHALAVADFNGDGRLDILVNEQEELLPAGRQNPRWVIWENRGRGQFVEHVILDTNLGGHELQVGDVQGTGRIDICSKIWGPMPWNGVGGKMHADFLENLRGWRRQ